MTDSVHRAAVSRTRRTIFHLDAIDQIYLRECPLRLGEGDLDGYRARLFDFIDNVPNQVTSIHWDCMYSGDEYTLYPSALRPRRIKQPMSRWADGGHDLFAFFVAEGRKRGLENVLVHRISEVDIDADTHPNPHKAAHPEMYLKRWLYNGTHNLAFEDIRARKLALLGECMANYAFDGLEIDFCRHTPFLPVGRQWENRDCATDFMRSLRAMLTALEEKDGRGRILSARVPDTVAGCHGDGLDIETWAEENLIDGLTCGSRSFDVALEDFRAATKGRVKLWPCYDAHHCTDGYADASAELMAGVFASWWDRGADGVSVFNGYTARNEIYERTGRFIDMPVNGQREALSFLGGEELLRSRDKTWVVERRGGYPWEEGCANNNNGKPLPLLLPNDGESRSVRLYVSDGLSRRKNEMTSLELSLVLYGLQSGDTVTVLLNGTPVAGDYDRGWTDDQIQAPNRELVSGYHIAALKPVENRPLTRVSCSPDAGLFNRGWNWIDVSVGRAGWFPYAQTASLERVEVSVKYK